MEVRVLDVLFVTDDVCLVQKKSTLRQKADN